MSFSITLRVFSVLCLAVVSVAGQWTGNYNLTYVGRNTVPPRECRIKNLARAIRPCVCTGGRVFPGCSLWRWAEIYNGVRDANCKCSSSSNDIEHETESLKAYGRDTNGQDKPGVVRFCVCDPPAGKRDDSTDELVVPAPNCWCPSKWFRSFTGLSEATESQAVPEIPPFVIEQSTTQQPGEQQPATGSLQWCRDDLNKKKQLNQKSVCKELMEVNPKEMSPSMQRILPNCNIPLLFKICTDIPQA